MVITVLLTLFPVLYFTSRDYLTQPGNHQFALRVEFVSFVGRFLIMSLMSLPVVVFILCHSVVHPGYSFSLSSSSLVTQSAEFDLLYPLIKFLISFVFLLFFYFGNIFVTLFLKSVSEDSVFWTPYVSVSAWVLAILFCFFLGLVAFDLVPEVKSYDNPLKPRIMHSLFQKDLHVLWRKAATAAVAWPFDAL